MSQEQKTKKQHTVPQFYLKQFTHDGKRLFVFDKLQQKSFPSNIRDVASENYFYDIPEDAAQQLGIDPQIVENSLAEIEASFSTIIKDLLKRIRKQPKKMIKRRYKKGMANFIALQSTRTKEHRSLQTQMIEKGMTAVLNKAAKNTSFEDQYFTEVDKEHVSLLQSGIMFNPYFQKQVVDVLCKHIWIIGINQTTNHLYSSDHPIIKMPHKRDPYISYGGFASEGIEIAVSLTPKYMLILCERSFHKGITSKDCKSIPLDNENIKYYNSLQVAQSYRQIYCSSDDFALAREMCSSHPELCTPDRPRIEVS